MKFVSLFSRKKKNESDFKIEDGRIISPKQNVYVKNDLRFEPMLYTSARGLSSLPPIKNFAPIDLYNVIQNEGQGGSCPDRVSFSEGTDNPKILDNPGGGSGTRELGCLNLPCKYHPSYLLDTRDGGDLGLFQDYLKHVGRSEETRRAYMIDLRVWRNCLNRELSIDKIQAVILKHTPHRAKRLLYSLRTYGRYRSFHGDPRFTVMLATAEIKMPVLPKSRREKLNEDAVAMYRKSARNMVKSGNRVGIWMGLTLLGLKSSEMATVTVNGDGKVHFVRAGEMVSKKCPGWLYSGLHEMNRSKWALGKSTIWKGMKSYGVTPFVLYHSCKRNGVWDN